MISYINCIPGQKITLLQEVLNINNERTDSVELDGYSDGYFDGYYDGYYYPIITEIISPSESLLDNYPATMEKFSVGLYKHNFIVPKGSSSIGTFIVNIEYYDDLLNKKHNTIAIIVTPPFGNTTVIPV
jgi:hypothetical protein